MSKPVKDMITSVLRDRYSEFESACVVQLTGLDVHATEDIRRKLRERSARLEVVKNSMARRAFEGTRLEPLGKALQGPCALVTAPEAIIEVAKELVDLARTFDSLQLKEAILEGDENLMTVLELSKMKSKADFLGEVAMLAMSPARSIAGCASSPQAKIAGCLKAIADEGEAESN